MDFIEGSLFLQLALITLLVIAAAQDLKTKEVSGWLTLFPLLATVAWRVATGGWILLLAFVIIALFSERIVCKSRGLALAAIVTGLVAVFFFLPGSPTYWTTLGWLAAWLLWEFNVIGGADVKLMMLLVTVYPDPRMFFLILLAKLVAGFIVPAALYGRRVAKRLFSAAFLVLAARQLPDRETLEREGLPAVFVYTMAGVAYVLVFASQCPPQSGIIQHRLPVPSLVDWTRQTTGLRDCVAAFSGAPVLPYGVGFGDPITWAVLALAFTIGTVPIALFLRSIPRTAGRPAGLHSPVDCTGRQASPERNRGTHPAGLHSPVLRSPQCSPICTCVLHAGPHGTVHRAGPHGTVHCKCALDGSSSEI